MFSLFNQNKAEKEIFKYLAFMRDRQMDFDPWVFLSDDDIKTTSKDINSHYPYRIIICFAHKQGSDDYACFVTKGKSAGKFIFIHWFATPGWETAQGFEFSSFGEMIEAIIDDIIDFE